VGESQLVGLGKVSDSMRYKGEGDPCSNTQTSKRSRLPLISCSNSHKIWRKDNVDGDSTHNIVTLSGTTVQLADNQYQGKKNDHTTFL
jgi:hypothetical protein